MLRVINHSYGGGVIALRVIADCYVGLITLRGLWAYGWIAINRVV
ncbi:hypothetical protein [Bartonella tribocorum]|nr:hypothetical protein [Bartonella tribocorum]